MKSNNRNITLGVILAAIVVLMYLVVGGTGWGGIAWKWWAIGGLAAILAAAYPFLQKANDTERRLVIARILLLLVAIAAASTAASRPSDILAMVGWAFSLAMAGNFPALVLGIWWKRATTAGAIAGIIAGFSLCIFYLVVTRYFPQLGVDYFGMTSMKNPVTGANVVDITKPIAATAAQRVGWFDLNNINCGLLGAPLGFIVMIVVSLMTPAPSKEMQALVDEIRKPRGKTIMEEKTS